MASQARNLRKWWASVRSVGGIEAILLSRRRGLGSSRPRWAVTRKNALLLLIVLVGLVAVAGVGAYTSGALDSVLPSACTIGQSGDSATVTIEGIGARHACDNATQPPSYGGPGTWVKTTPSNTQVSCSYKVGGLRVTVRWSQSTVGFDACESPFDPAAFDPQNPTAAVNYTCLSGHCGPVPQPTPAPTPYGWIVVSATDPSSNPLSGITVSLTETTSEAVTDAAGHAYVPVPEPGNYKAVVSTAQPSCVAFQDNAHATNFLSNSNNDPQWVVSAGDNVVLIISPQPSGGCH
jgi:hypothetical protein